MKPFLFLLLALWAAPIFSQDITLNPSPHDLHFERLPTAWDEGIPLGNGMLGALVWQKDGKLRISLDRADLWDLRPMREMYDSTFTWPWVVQKVKEKDYAPVQQMGDVPYEREPAPTKIPAGAIEFEVAELGEVDSVRLFIRNGICQVKWKGGASLLVYVHAVRQEGYFAFFDTKPITPRFVPPAYEGASSKPGANSVEGQGLHSLGYKRGSLSSSYNRILYSQPCWDKFSYFVNVTHNQTAVAYSGSWHILTTQSDKIDEGNRPLFDFSSDAKTHQAWWDAFWKKSTLSLPDKALERQWHLEQYKFACAARNDAPPISLQAIWTADNGNLPPWKGDFHHDLNTQLSYWPAYSGNHLDLELGYLNWLDLCRPAFRAYTRRFFKAPGLNVPGVTTLTGEPMGGWIQYSMSPTVSAWLGQHFYLHWRYSMDTVFLENRAYPWMRGVATFLENVTTVGSNGTRQLPISSSPEIHDNRLEAWFLQNTNYDIALMRFAFEKAAEMALVLGKSAEAGHWQRLAAQLPPLAVDEAGGLMFAPGEPYAEPHRHFSHLMAWHPLGLLDWSDEGQRRTIEATLADLEKQGSKYWVGYSFSWLGNLYARARKGDKAAEALRTFARCFCLPNSFHCNGDQCGHVTEWHYRPFTLEGNFAFAAGLQEMLLQSHTGIVEVFPAIPADWKDLSFENLRAEGAFLVSAKMEKGAVTEIRITAERGGELRLRNVFPGGVFRPVKATKFTEDGVVAMRMEAGETVVLRQ